MQTLILTLIFDLKMNGEVEVAKYVVTTVIHNKFGCLKYL